MATHFGSTRHQGGISQQKQPAATPEGLSLPKFVEKYSKQLPLRAKFLQGYYGQNLHLEVGDVCTVHFVKQKQVARVSDVDGNSYSIPLSSSLQFGMVFSPKRRIGADVQIVKFEKVSDLIALRPLPKVVRATKAFKGVTEQSLVEVGEVFIITAPEVSVTYREVGLKVFSLLTKSEKILPGSCAGCFSIYPPLLRMYLPEFVSHLGNCLPCQAQVFLDKEAPRVSNILSTLLSSPVTVQEVVSESSVIVSSEKKPIIHSKSVEGLKILAIPVNETFSGIQLSAFSYSDRAQKKLTETTRKILTSFEPALHECLKETKSGRTQRVQSVLYSTLRTGSEGVGVTLISSLGEVVLAQQFTYDHEGVTFARPKQESAVYELIPGDEQGARNKTAAIKKLHIYQPLDLKQRSTTEQKYDIPFQQSNKVAPGPGRAASDHHKHTHASQTQEGNIRLLSAAPAKDFLRLSPLQAHLVPLRDKNLPPLPQPHLPLPTPNPISKEAAATITNRRTGSNSTHIKLCEALPGDELLPPPQPDNPQNLFHSREPLFPEAKRELSVEEANRRFLHSMNVTQVQDLLEAMGLTRYSDAFAAEGITGEILAELDDDTLQQELGVNSKLHQIRLMKVITGKHSAQNILEGMDPYEKGTHV